MALLLWQRHNPSLKCEKKNIPAAPKLQTRCSTSDRKGLDSKPQIRGRTDGVKTAFTRSIIKASRGRQVQGDKSWQAKVQKQAEFIKKGRKENDTKNWNALAGRHDKKSSTEGTGQAKKSKFTGLKYKEKIQYNYDKTTVCGGNEVQHNLLK